MVSNEHELKVTQEKLRQLEDRYSASRSESSENPRVREHSLRSLKRMINQLKEEIARFEAQSVGS